MPSTSKKQHNFMEAVAHNPAFAKKAGVPQSVGQDFATADKGKKFAKGGLTMAKSTDAGNSKTMQKVRTAAPSKDGVAIKGKTKGKQIVMSGNKMCGGGMAKGKK
jgi:hypothetical protein